MRYGFAILLAIDCVAFAGGFDFGGYVKNFNTVVYPPKIEGISLPEMTGAASYRIDLKMSYSPAKFFLLKVSYDLMPRFTDDKMVLLEGISGSGTKTDYRVADIPSCISPAEYDGSGAALLQNLDRAMVAVYLPFADVEIGRQSIGWGSARVVNPTDIITPFTFDALDVEERPGVDAVRIRVPLGAMSEVDMGYLPGHDFDSDSAAAYAKAKFYFQKTNISALVVGIDNYALVGLDLARSIGGAGSWLEAAYFNVEDLFYKKDVPPISEGSDYTITDGYLRLSAGADYSFSEKLYGFIEYHYNGAGEFKPSSYFRNNHKVAYKKGGVYLMSQNYIAPGGFYQFTPLFSGGLNCLWNLNDYSAMLSPNLEYNFAQDVYISLGANIGFGKGGIESNDDVAGYPPTGKSEFGLYPDMWFMSFRVYF